MPGETTEKTALTAAPSGLEVEEGSRVTAQFDTDLDLQSPGPSTNDGKTPAACATFHWRAWPPQILFIMGNETCERLSFYGMRAILVVYMTEHLKFSAPDAESAFHLFTAACFLLPLFGGWLADNIIGRYRVVLYLSVFYCLGHAVLAVWESKPGLAVGLALVSLGAGGIKPCVAAMVGDQFDEENKEQLPSVFALFYWCINLGSFIATATIPIVMRSSVFWAFSIPGIFMAISLGIFWAGRKQYVLVEPAFGAVEKPAGFLRVTSFALRSLPKREHGQGFWTPAKQHFSAEEVEAAQAVVGLLQLFLYISMYSALFDQHSSTWVVQAQAMNLDLLGWQVPPAQMQALNPVLVMLLIPFFEMVVYPGLVALGVRLTPLRKMSAGMLLTSLSFVVIAVLQALLDAGWRPSVLWQAPAYLILTFAEVLVSTTGLQFAYSQAPLSMKSTIMSLWLLTVFLGNMLDAAVTKLNVFSGAIYFLFFAALMLAVAALFILAAVRYRMRDYDQEGASGRKIEAVEDGDGTQLLSSGQFLGAANSRTQQL